MLDVANSELTVLKEFDWKVKIICSTDVAGNMDQTILQLRMETYDGKSLLFELGINEARNLLATIRKLSEDMTKE